MSASVCSGVLYAWCDIANMAPAQQPRRRGPAWGRGGDPAGNTASLSTGLTQSCHVPLCYCRHEPLLRLVASGDHMGYLCVFWGLKQGAFAVQHEQGVIWQGGVPVEAACMHTRTRSCFNRTCTTVGAGTSRVGASASLWTEGQGDECMRWDQGAGLAYTIHRVPLVQCQASSRLTVGITYKKGARGVM